MAGNNSIQILRGSISYNPDTVELLDGQPFYSKKSGKFYVGTGGNNKTAFMNEGQVTDAIKAEATARQKFDNSHNNIENGEGLDSIVQKYSGDVNTSFGNTNTGFSSAVFGVANKNTANCALIAGKLNENGGDYAVIFGSGNINDNSASAYSFLAGEYLQGSTVRSQAIFGRYNKPSSALFIIGSGTSNTDEGRENIFEAYSDGAKVYGNLTLESEPTEDHHAATIKWVEGRLSSTIDSDFFNSLY